MDEMRLAHELYRMIYDHELRLYDILRSDISSIKRANRVNDVRPLRTKDRTEPLRMTECRTRSIQQEHIMVFIIRQISDTFASIYLGWLI